MCGPSKNLPESRALSVFIGALHEDNVYHHLVFDLYVAERRWMTVFLFISIEDGLRCDCLACREALKKWHEPERSTKREVISPPV